jgi:hypothetical protein
MCPASMGMAGSSTGLPAKQSIPVGLDGHVTVLCRLGCCMAERAGAVCCLFAALRRGFGRVAATPTDKRALRASPGPLVAPTGCTGRPG